MARQHSNKTQEEKERARAAAESRKERKRRGKEIRKRKEKEKRKEKKQRLNLTQKQKRVLAIVLIVFALFMLTYGRKIIRLQIDNRRLRIQQEELEKEKSAKTKELKNINSKEYIEEQAREKLRLQNKDEKMFIFKDDNEDE